MHRVLRYLVLTTLLLPAALVSCQQFDCSRGCPGSRGAEVCGEDGLTYQHSCLAVCQGVAVVRQGRCEDASSSPPAQQLQGMTSISFMEAKPRPSSSSSSSSMQAQDPVYSPQDMQQYSRHGYRLLGRADAEAFDPHMPQLQLQQQQQHQQLRQGPVSAGAAATAVRHNSRGYVYQLSPALQRPPPQSPQANAVASPATATAAGLSSQQLRLERAAYEATADAAALRLDNSAVSAPPPAPAAAAAVGGVGSLQLSNTLPPAPQAVAAASGGSATATGVQEVPSLSAPQQTEVLLQYMQTADAGRRRLLEQVVDRVAAVLQQHWRGGGRQHHSLHHQQPQQSLSQQQLQEHRQQEQQYQHQHQETKLPQRSLSFILGRDDRKEVQVPSTRPNSAWPYSAVGQFLYPKGSCSGVMVGPGSVLTAAHCVYSKQINTWQKDMVFVPHRHRQGKRIVEPYGRIPVDYVTTYTGWTNNPNITDALRYDLAVVKLKDSIGHKTGFLGVAWDKQPYGGKVYTAGYPGDKTRGSLWSTSCRVTDFGGSDTRFLTTCDSSNGQSGSPIWERRGADMYYLRAVMSYEACQCCSPDCSCCQHRTNGATKITHAHYKNIMKWM